MLRSLRLPLSLTGAAALALASTPIQPVAALPTRLSCSESDGVYIMEANTIMDYYDSKKAERPICTSIPLEKDCVNESIYLDDASYTIEFNSDTQEAVVDRESLIIFYNFDETKDGYLLTRKRRPEVGNTYQKTGYQSFDEYRIFVNKDSLSSVYTYTVDRSDLGTADEGGISYTTIINGSCKNNPF